MAARKIAAALAVVAALALACSKAETARGDGVVLSAHGDGRVVIEHGELPGVLGTATTEFEVDPDLLRDVGSGDHVRFAVKAEGGRFHVTEIRKDSSGG